MSEEVHLEEHSSPIKTPKELVTVLALSFILPVIIIGMLAHVVTGGFHTGSKSTAQAADAVAKRLKPVGEVEVVDANAPKIEKSGKEIVDAVCGACHGTGVLNAPKIGDTAAWKKLIAQGLPKLTQDAIKGVGSMPPRGGNPDLSDTEVARAIAYMANQSGANWKEPAPAPVAAKPAAAPSATTPATTSPATASVPAASTQPTAVPAGAAGPQAQAAAAGAPAGAAGDKGGAPGVATANKGKAVFDANCVVCHGAGVAGAPKLGDKAAWAPRLKMGIEALYASSIKGKGAMPPKGGNLALSDADVKAAVDYQVSAAK